MSRSRPTATKHPSRTASLDPAEARTPRAHSVCHHETLDIAIALPGRPGESTDWLDVLRREGADAVRAGILAATPFAPTAAELDAPKLGKNRVPLIRVMGGDLADATAATLRVLAESPTAGGCLRARHLAGKAGADARPARPPTACDVRWTP